MLRIAGELMRGFRHHRDVPTAVGSEPLRFAKLKPDRSVLYISSTAASPSWVTEAKRPCTRLVPPVLFGPHISTKVPRGNALRQSISGIPQEMDSCSRLGRGVKAEGMRPARDASIWDRKSATLLMAVFALYSPSGKYDLLPRGCVVNQDAGRTRLAQCCEFHNYMPWNRLGALRYRRETKTAALKMLRVKLPFLVVRLGDQSSRQLRLVRGFEVTRAATPNERTQFGLTACCQILYNL